MRCASINNTDLDESKACGSRINKVCKPWHIFQFMMSMEPGAAASQNACYCHADPATGCVFGNLLAGMVHMLTCICIVGFLNSLAFGVGIYRKSEL